MDHKESRLGALRVDDDEAGGTRIEGYASVFGAEDGGGDIVEPGAFAASLRRLTATGGRVRMLWQHDPSQPIGVWEEVREDGRGLHVRGRILGGVERGREAAALIRSGAIDGLSIGYRAVRATKDARGRRRLGEVDLWEVSLVTFPMLAAARVAPEAVPAAPDAPGDRALLGELASAVALARARLTT